MSTVEPGFEMAMRTFRTALLLFFAYGVAPYGMI